MSSSETQVRYSKSMIAIHWLTALLVIVAYSVSEGAREVRADPPVLHFACGFAVLLLVLPRLFSRACSRLPAAAEAGPRWLTLAATLGHAFLYFLMVGVPLTGWYALSRLGVAVTFLGFKVPALTAAVHGRIGPIGDVHQIGGNALLVLAGLHAALGLWHQFIRRDHTLERMSPF
jgi:cytochrome b561